MLQPNPYPLLLPKVREGGLSDFFPPFFVVSLPLPPVLSPDVVDPFKLVMPLCDAVVVFSNPVGFSPAGGRQGGLE